MAGAPSGSGVSAGGSATRGGGAAGGSTRAPGGASPKSASYLRTERNMQSVECYAAALCIILGIFILAHFTKVIAYRTGLSKKSIAKPFVAISRIARNIFVRKAPVLPSWGHVSLALVYWGINLAIAFTNLDNSVLTLHNNLAARFGWMAVSNVVFVVFLSLKNTPLAYLSPWTYERINVLHRIAGYTTFAIVILHGCTYASYFGEMGNIRRLRTNEEKMGIAAAFSVLMVVIASTIVRRFWYELFYVMHVCFFMLTVIFIGLHQPEVSHKIMIATALVGSMWCADRLVRFVRVALYSINNNVTLEALPNGGTKIQIKKEPYGTVSGGHCFLWIPAVRKFEMHPFTIVSATKHEFIVASYDGFTRDLHNYAMKSPGTPLRASVEGPYGKFPDPLAFNRVIMIAGGSGASFTFGTALSMLQKWPQDKKVSFHWIVKNRGYFAWFENYIQVLRDSGKVDIHLHVTDSTPGTPRPASLTQATSSSDEGLSSPIDEKPGVQYSTPPPTRGRLPEDPEKADLEPSTPVETEHAGGCSGNCGAHAICGLEGISITSGRPDVAALIRSEVSLTAPKERVLVMGCGPRGLMNTVRNTAASSIKPSGPGVEVHCEQFGW